MISIQDKHKCCGCSACSQICPKRCIVMQPDKEGFQYPKVDISSCVNCHLCEKVCPVINQAPERSPLDIIAAKNKIEAIRLQSSSGGAFSKMAEKTISDRGVVYGAVFDDDYMVHHIPIEKEEEICLFRGSKYVQSELADTFRKIKNQLEEGRQILFSGTPCQIAGLLHFLSKPYENLITVDLACHGVPSPALWEKYVKCIGSITDFSFRDKITGWKRYSISYVKKGRKKIEYSGDNLYMQAFLKNLSLRPSCYNCPAKSGKSGADITMADFWKIWEFKPEIDDDKGVSAVLINTAKGKAFFDTIDLEKYSMGINQVLTGNTSLICSSLEPEERDSFWTAVERNDYSTIKSLCRTKPSIMQKIKRRLFQ